jgi:serine phosphatase RsbU (regulator of sigma subunit)
MPLSIDVAVAKTNKYASRESGDTVEIVERPGGGISVIMADGQGSGRAAKTLSMLVTARVTALLKEGVRDGAAARAANDYLLAMRHGQVSATLDVLSVDLKTMSVVITRNSGSAGLISSCDGFEVVPGDGLPLGLHARTRPWTREFELRPYMVVVLVTDGIINAGKRTSMEPLDLAQLLSPPGTHASSVELADAILAAAIGRDQGKPADDMSVVVLALPEHHESTIIRRMRAEVPLP